MLLRAGRLQGGIHPASRQGLVLQPIMYFLNRPLNTVRNNRGLILTSGHVRGHAFLPYALYVPLSDRVCLPYSIPHKGCDAP